MRILATITSKPSQILNSLGKYFFANLSGANRWQKSSNMFDIWTTVLYQIPQEVREKYNLPQTDEFDVKEMTLNLNITTYQNKLRFNVIEQKSNMTIGHKVINLDLKKYQSLKTNQELYQKVLQEFETWLKKVLEKRFAYYDFLF